MQYEIKSNFGAFADEFIKLSQKRFDTIKKQTMSKSLKSGRKESISMIERIMKRPKDQNKSTYYRDNIKTSVGFETGKTRDAHIWFSGRRRGLAAYVTPGRLASHRKNRSKAGRNAKKARKVKPLIFDIKVGKKTTLKRAFSAKKSGRWQVFRRKTVERTPVGRPTGPTTAQTVRGNSGVENKTIDHISKTYRNEFFRRWGVDTNRALKRAARKAVLNSF